MSVLVSKENPLRWYTSVLKEENGVRAVEITDMASVISPFNVISTEDFEELKKNADLIFATTLDTQTEERELLKELGFIMLLGGKSSYTLGNKVNLHYWFKNE